MNQQLIPLLPQPIAKRVQELIEEEISRSADEIANVLVTMIEYLGAVALADYFEGSDNPEECAGNESLNGWLVSQLAVGKAEAGHWARWTQIAVQSTPAPKVLGLREYVAANDLDDPNSNLSWLLRFRNDVMHGGFVAPLPKIKQALVRLQEVFLLLQPIWSLQLIGCLHSEPEGSWRSLCGLHATLVEQPNRLRTAWQGAGAVLLVDSQEKAVLALHPACYVDVQGIVHLQHDWRNQHSQWFERSAQIRGFFIRYQVERQGKIDATDWHQLLKKTLPACGYISRPQQEKLLLEGMASGAAIICLAAMPGAGRSTLVQHIAKISGRNLQVFPVRNPSVRMDPQVLRRWVALAVAEIADEPGVLVVDDADLVAQGIYQGSPTSGCFKAATEKGIPCILIHTLRRPPPVSGDIQLVLPPWSKDELKAWGESDHLWQKTGGHPALMVDLEAGLQQLQQRLAVQQKRHPIGYICLQHLQAGSATSLELAQKLQLLGPKVEMALRCMVDWLIEEKRLQDGNTKRFYTLHPATQIALRRMSS